MSSTSLAKQAYTPETDRLDLGELFPALRTYCPILYGTPSIHEHPQQCLFLLLDNREAFYGGAAGGGKTAALLASAIQHVDVPGYAALILRRTFPQLDQPGNLIPLAREWFAQVPERDRPSWNEQRKTWTFPSGAVLRFGHVQDQKAVLNYQGGAYHFVGFDELTQFPEDAYTYIAFSRQRRTTQLADIGVPIRVRATSNPGGLGHGWVKSRFITNRAADTVFIPAKVRDNPGLDADDYEASLQHLPTGLRKQLLDGDWDAFEGMAYPDFKEGVHVVPGFDTSGLDRFECMDFGVSNPTAWLVVATDYDRNLIVFDELYGPNTDSSGKPVGGLPSETAPLVLARRSREWPNSWGRHDEDGWQTSPSRAWADPSIRNSAPIAGRMGTRTSVEQEFADLGVRLTPANNDRRAGYLRVAELVKPDPQRRFPAWHPRAGEYGAPRLYVFQHCAQTIEQLRSAPLEMEGKPLHGEAVSGEWESQYGHAHAALRYGALSRPQPSERPEETIEDPRRAAAAAMERRLRAQLDIPDDEDDDHGLTDI